MRAHVRLYRLVFFVLLFVTSSMLSARRKPEVWVEHTDYELGTLDRSASPTYILEVPIRNTGKGKLKIERVETSCDCTVAELSARRIRGGKSAQLTIRVDLKKLELGEIMRCVSLYTNADEEPVTVCFVATIVENGNHPQLRR